MKYIVLLLLSTLSLNSLGQKNSSTPSGAVIYEFTHIYDTLNKEKPRKEQMLLLYSPTSSTYKSYSEILDGAERKEDMKRLRTKD